MGRATSGVMPPASRRGRAAQKLASTTIVRFLNVAIPPNTDCLSVVAIS
jgi:hypothetical protein